MDVSQNGINLIKKYEGCRLKAYKPVATEKYFTIGYGHYGADVKQGMTITQEQADAYLKQDCAASVKAVNALGKAFNQNQFDALVSFCYNCGFGNLKSLCNGRSIDQIGNKIILYNKAGGKVLSGLVKRRKEEQALYKMDCTATSDVKYYPKYTGTTDSIVAALQDLRIDSNFNCRKKIAAANGITDYKGTAQQNIKLLNLLKEGKLKKA